MTPQSYFIKDGYIQRLQPDYFEDAVPDGIVWQPDVYAAATCIARRLKCSHFIDIGCGQAGKLVPLHPEFKIVGVDFGPNIRSCRNRYPFGQWFETDLETSSRLPIPPEVATQSVVICADVIEHLKDPTALLRLLHALMDHAPALVLSTPERDLCRGAEHLGPPPNPAHVREWNQAEMGALLRYHGFTVDFIGLTARNNQTWDKRTLIAFAANHHRPVSLVANLKWGQALIVTDRGIVPDAPAPVPEPAPAPMAAPSAPISATGSRMTLLLFVDALRPDYIKRTTYLQELAAISATGKLRERFGFVQHPAYFGGIPDFPFTNQYCFDPASSPFQMARALPACTGGPAMENRFGLRSLLDRSVRERVTRYAATYVNSMAAPLKVLPFFDVVEQYAPWDSRVGYRSIFHQLDEHHMPWLQCSWPVSNQLPDHSDTGIVRHVLTALAPEHRFAFVHLQELDAVGHQFGPNSQELDARLLQTDNLCQKLITSLRARYQHLDLVLFGDHGMVSVTRTVDVAQALAKTGLQLGIDYMVFLDSTMARFWFFHLQARRIVEQALDRLSGGRCLDARDLERYGLKRCEKANGELIFLAEPGVLIFPNYFQADGKPVEGMHGYDPDCPDNLGYFLCHLPEDDGLRGCDVGTVEAWQLHPLLCRLLQLSPGGCQPSSLFGHSRPCLRRYTPQADPTADTLVQAHLDAIITKVHKQVGQVAAIVLTGSFGRGEGGVYRDSAGQFRPVNDYDLLVVDPRDLSEPLKGLGETLAHDLGIDFVDLGYSDGRWERLPQTIFNYDLKYGSQIIAGDSTVLDRVPAYASADMPVYETVKLLLNRTAGLLSGLRGAFLTGQQPTPDERRYLTNQIVKALMAIGDGHLLRWNGYDSSYRARGQRFKWLAPGAGLDPALADKVCEAYDFKCQPDYSRFGDSLAEIRLLHPHLEWLLLQAINQLTESSAKALHKALTTYLAQLSTPADAIQNDNARCMAHPAMKGLLQPGCRTPASLRHLVYSVLPPLLAAVAVPSRAGESCGQVRQALQATFALPRETGLDADSWEQLRARVVRAWFAVCH